MKTHLLNHRHIGGEKRDMWWLLTASYIIQFNENSLAKPQTYRRREKIYVLYIKQFIESSPPNPQTYRRREKKYVVVILQPHT